MFWVKNELKIIFWIEKTKAPFFQQFFKTIIDNTSSIVLVKNRIDNALFVPLISKNKIKTHTRGPKLVGPHVNPLARLAWLIKLGLILIYIYIYII
jgi:hypothetical protein